MLVGFAGSCAHENASQQANRNSALCGTWSCVSAVVDGKGLPEQTTKLLRLTITETAYKTQKGAEVLFESSYKTDTTKSPNEINMVGTEGELAGKEAQGIFELAGNRLKICYTMPELERPKKFESNPGSKAYLLMWQKM